MTKKLFCLLLTVSLLTVSALAAPVEMPTAVWSDTWPLLPVVKPYEGTLTDAEGAWCANAIVTCYEAGLMEGKTTNRFDAAAPLSNAQIVVISARLHSRLRDGDGTFPPPADGEAWYRPALAYLLAQEDPIYLLEELSRQEDDALANEPCHRLNFVRLVDSVLLDEPYPRETLNPAAYPPDNRHEAVIRFYQAGILTGSDLYGTFGESAPLTRGAAASILARYVEPLQRQRFELLSFDLCRDILQLDPETPLLTIDGREIPAELFASQLCTSLYQWGRQNTARAQSAAITHFCEAYAVPALAAEKGVTLTAEQQESAIAAAQDHTGFLGTGTAYQLFQQETVLLNLTLKNHYRAANEKWGEGAYQSDLAARAKALAVSAVPTAALSALDLTAVYDRLTVSPWPAWNFQT